MWFLIFCAKYLLEGKPLYLRYAGFFVKGRVVFFCPIGPLKLKKISTLLPLTICLFTVYRLRRQRGTWKNFQVPLSSADSTAKIASLYIPKLKAQYIRRSFPPAPPAASKNLNARKLYWKFTLVKAFIKIEIAYPKTIKKLAIVNLVGNMENCLSL